MEGTCVNCGYHARVFTGSGLKDCERSTAMAIAKCGVKMRMELNQSQSFQIDRKLAICGKCKEIVTAATVCYETEDGQQKIIPAVCPECEGPLVIPPLTAEKVPCPVCGTPVTFEKKGHWD